MKAILEPPIHEHGANLYAATTITPHGEGFVGFGDRELQEYRERGFLVIRGGFPLQSTDTAVQELTAMMLADDPRCNSVYFESTIRSYLGDGTPSQRDRVAAIPKVHVDIRAQLVRKFMGFSATRPSLATFMQDADLLRIVVQILGEPARCFQEMALIKPPHGQEKPLHQDHAYFNIPIGTKVVGVWIALADVTPEMGCMQVVAGGHLAGPPPHFNRRDWQICDDDMLRDRRLALTMQAGDLLFFDGKLPHGTPINRTDRQRFAIQFHFLPQSATETNDEERLKVFGSEGKTFAAKSVRAR